MATICKIVVVIWRFDCAIVGMRIQKQCNKLLCEGFFCGNKEI